MSISYRIEGGRPLNGEIKVAGNKNAILPIMAACILTDQVCTITNVPRIKDVEVMSEILTSLGAKIEGLGSSKLVIKTPKILETNLDPLLVSRLRASVLFLGPLLARTSEVTMRHPGGCVIGRRNVDTHLQALEALGAKATFNEDGYTLKTNKFLGGRVFLQEPSVTATENAMMFAASQGETVIENAACEPHVRNLGEFLISMGVEIQGLGSNRLSIKGGIKSRPAQVEVVPDQIEVGTWLIAGAVTNGRIKITHIRPRDLDMILLYLGRMGVNFELSKDFVEVRPAKLVSSSSGKFQTRPWPGFPTDLMSPFLVLATQAKGTTLAHDWMYEARMFFVDKLIRMGASIVLCDPHRVLVTGPTKLRGKQLESPDIRAGMALVLAALAAEGESVIQNAQLVERGYELADVRLRQLGAKIERLED